MVACKILRKMVLNLEFYIEPNYHSRYGKTQKICLLAIFCLFLKLFKDVLRQNLGVQQESQERNSVSTPGRTVESQDVNCIEANSQRQEDGSWAVDL